MRSIVGLDRQAAKEALGDFAHTENLSANQIHFVNLVVDYLAQHGHMAPKVLYGSPFTDIGPQGPDALFPPTRVDALLERLDVVRSHAIAT